MTKQQQQQQQQYQGLDEPHLYQQLNKGKKQTFTIVSWA
jgi:hypothetical protein